MSRRRKTDNHDANTDCRGGACRRAGGAPRTRRPGPDQGSQRRGRSADRRSRRRPHRLADGARRLRGHRVRGCRIRRGPRRTRLDLLRPDQHPQPARGRRRRTRPPASPAACSPWAEPGRTDRGRQPQRFHPARPRPRRDRAPSTPRGGGSSATDSTGCCWCPPTSKPAGSPPATSIGPTSAGEPVPVGDSEFAKDATFGYTSSEPAGIRRREEQRHDHRGPGPLHLADRHPRGRTRPGRRNPGRGDRRRVRRGQRHRLRRPGDRRARPAQAQAARQVVRIPLWPIVPAGAGRAGPAGPLTAEQIWPAGRPGGHGLVVVGSHVGLTSRQVAKAQERGGLIEAELHVPTLLDPERARRSCRRHRQAGRRGSGHLRCAAVHQPHPAARRRRRRQPGHLPQRLHRGRSRWSRPP